MQMASLSPKTLQHLRTDSHYNLLLHYHCLIIRTSRNQTVQKWRVVTKCAEEPADGAGSRQGRSLSRRINKARCLHCRCSISESGREA